MIKRASDEALPRLPAIGRSARSTQRARVRVEILRPPARPPARPACTWRAWHDARPLARPARSQPPSQPPSKRGGGSIDQSHLCCTEDPGFSPLKGGARGQLGCRPALHPPPLWRSSSLDTTQQALRSRCRATGNIPVTLSQPFLPTHKKTPSQPPSKRGAGQSINSTCAAQRTWVSLFKGGARGQPGCRPAPHPPPL